MVAEKLRERAHEYELNAAAAEERGEIDSANGFHAVEVALREFADVVETTLDEEPA